MPQRGVPDILILFIRLYSRLYKCQNVLGEYGAVMDDGRGTNGDRPCRRHKGAAGCASAGRAAGGARIGRAVSVSPAAPAPMRLSGSRLVRAGSALTAATCHVVTAQHRATHWRAGRRGHLESGRPDRCRRAAAGRDQPSAPPVGVDARAPPPSGRQSPPTRRRRRRTVCVTSDRRPDGADGPAPPPQRAGLGDPDRTREARGRRQHAFGDKRAGISPLLGRDKSGVEADKQQKQK